MYEQGAYTGAFANSFHLNTEQHQVLVGKQTCKLAQVQQ